MLEESNITIIAAESFKNDPSSSVKYLLKVKWHQRMYIISTYVTRPHVGKRRLSK